MSDADVELAALLLGNATVTNAGIGTALFRDAPADIAAVSRNAPARMARAHRMSAAGGRAVLLQGCYDRAVLQRPICLQRSCSPLLSLCSIGKWQGSPNQPIEPTTTSSQTWVTLHIAAPVARAPPVCAYPVAQIQHKC